MQLHNLLVHGKLCMHGIMHSMNTSVCIARTELFPQYYEVLRDMAEYHVESQKVAKKHDYLHWKHSYFSSLAPFT